MLRAWFAWSACISLVCCKTHDEVLVFDSMTFISNGLSFETRAFNGTIPGPVIRVKPGDTLRIKLINVLGSDALRQVDSENQPRSSRRLRTRDARLGDAIDCTGTKCTETFTPYNHPNSTNLHTHGLHISPLPPSDDVLDTVVAPGTEYTYTYKIPENHMPGMFWYHPHLHGSVAIQTAGGAAGVLIIEDAKDTVPSEISDMKEQIVLLQTIPFAALRGISEYSSSGGTELFRVLHADLPRGWETFTTENNQHGDEMAQATPGNASLIDNFALVNGEFHSRLKVEEGRWTRWRIVHAGLSIVER
jgi:FtsP/CotA-like multicopper oxidase with cupredoxin domain